MLFILAIDCMIELASEQVMPALIGSQEPNLHISLYPDDAAIFIITACQNWTPFATSSTLLDRLLGWSWSYKNAPSCQLVEGVNIDQIILCLPLYRGSSCLSCQYLGLRKLTKAHIQPIIDKTGTILPSWKGWLTCSTRFPHQFQDTRSLIFSSPNGPKSSLVGYAVPSFGWGVTMRAVANVL